MSGPSDKARAYLELSVSELNELERKKIFSREEISSIAKKRSDFEHIINARGSQPSDYVRYIEFEKNLQALRQKRVQRLGVKAPGRGQRTIFFLYSRAVRKFSGDLDLWIQYIEFAKQEKSYKKLNEIFASVVRLHSTKPEIWIYAAHYFMDTQADITNARSYMQRGLRFCKKSESIWIQYAKLETIYIGKIAGRRKILGLDVDRTEKTIEDDPNGDMITLPTITAEDINPTVPKDSGDDEVALQNLDAAPVLSGAIPMAVFDSAMKQFHNDPVLAEQFFNMFAEFEQLPSLGRILGHVLAHLQETSPTSTSTILCEFRMQLHGIHPLSPSFPPALRASLGVLNKNPVPDSPGKSGFAQSVLRVLLPLLRTVREAEEPEPALEKVLQASIRKYTRILEESAPSNTGDEIVKLASALRREKKGEDAKLLASISTKHYGGNEKLLQFQQLVRT